MPPHPLNNFGMQKYYQNKPKFNCAYSKSDLPKIKDGAYVINLDEFKSIGTDWKALYVNGNNVIYFDSFEVEHIPKEVKKFIGNKNIVTNIYRIQAYNLKMCRHFALDSLILRTGKSLLDHTNLFSSNKYEKNDKIIQKYFQ